jgi:hypothetical protein
MADAKEDRRNLVESEEPEGRASRGTTTDETSQATSTPPVKPKGGPEFAVVPPREESIESDVERNPHQPRRSTM